jgi:hypothetical protein
VRAKTLSTVMVAPALVALLTVVGVVLSELIK